MTNTTPEQPLIQVMRPGAMGDLLMCTAVLPGLKAQGYRVRFVAHPKFASVLEGNPYIDELYTVKEGTKELMTEATAHLDPADRYEYLYYPFYAKRDLPGHPIPMHLTTYFCESVGVPPTDDLSVYLTEEQLAWGETYKDVVLVHTTTMWSPYKNWPMDRWQQLVTRIRSELGVDVMQIGGKKDTLIEGVAMVPSPSIFHAIAALKQCRLFIGLDSVFNHASRAVNKPSIILWGSTHPLGMGYRQNLNLLNGVVWQHVMGNDGPTMRCQPCYREYSGPGNNNNQRACPYTLPYHTHALPQKMHAKPEINACMASNTVDSVFYHAKAMLALPTYPATHVLETSN